MNIEDYGWVIDDLSREPFALTEEFKIEDAVAANNFLIENSISGTNMWVRFDEEPDYVIMSIDSCMDDFKVFEVELSRKQLSDPLLSILKTEVEEFVNCEVKQLEDLGKALLKQAEDYKVMLESFKKHYY